jgi:Ca2+/H+ antiporter
MLVLNLIIHNKLNTSYNRAQYKFPVPVQFIPSVQVCIYFFGGPLFIHFLADSVYVYIYMCVCVCVCVFKTSYGASNCLLNIDLK